MTPREFLDFCAERSISVSVCEGRLRLEKPDGLTSWLARCKAHGIEAGIVAELQARSNVIAFRPRAVCSFSMTRGPGDAA